MMLLGVLVGKSICLRLKEGKYLSGMYFLAEESVKENIELIVFSPSDINWYEKSIIGLLYNSKNKIWEYGECSFPEMIYNRANFQKDEKELGKLTIKRFEEEYRIPFLNSKHYFGKWETHNVLLPYTEINKHLPDTVLYHHPIQVINFLSKYKTAYIKPSGGSFGKDIYRLKLLYDEIYMVSYRENGKNYSDRLSLQGFHSRIINGKLSGKKLIIQQGIELASLGDRPFDIRMLLQKNEVGKWEVVDKSVRVAAAGSVVTNVSSGGEVKRFDDIIPFVFPGEYERIRQEIDMMALKVCEKLEKKYGALGELGIDAAVDKSGAVWLLEVNSKPSKVSVRRSENIALISRAYKNPIKYFKYVNSQHMS